MLAPTHRPPLVTPLDIHQHHINNLSTSRPDPRFHIGFRPSTSPFSLRRGASQMHSAPCDADDSFVSMRMNPPCFNPFARMVQTFQNLQTLQDCQRGHHGDHIPGARFSRPVKGLPEDRLSFGEEFRGRAGLANIFLGKQLVYGSIFGSAETFHRLRCQLSSRKDGDLDRDYNYDFQPLALTRSAYDATAGQYVNNTAAAQEFLKRSIQILHPQEEHRPIRKPDSGLRRRQTSHCWQQLNRNTGSQVVNSRESESELTEIVLPNLVSDCNTTKSASSPQGFSSVVSVSVTPSESAAPFLRQDPHVTSTAPFTKAAETDNAAGKGTARNLKRDKPRKLKLGPKRRERLHHQTGPPTAAASILRRSHKLKAKGTESSQPQQPGELRKAFKCSQCRYRTDRKNNLKRHVVTMHQKSTRVLECCGAVFHSKASLRDHVALFHRGGYRCQVCGRNFCRKALLRRHLTVHSGQKDFSCHLCGYATSHKSNLERHQRVHARKSGLSLGQGFMTRHPRHDQRSASSPHTQEDTTFLQDNDDDSSCANACCHNDDALSSQTWEEVVSLEQTKDCETPRCLSPEWWKGTSAASTSSSEWSCCSNPDAEMSQPVLLDVSKTPEENCDRNAPSVTFRNDEELYQKCWILSRKFCFPNRLHETYSSRACSEGVDETEHPTDPEAMLTGNTFPATDHAQEEHFDINDDAVAETAKENENPSENSRSAASHKSAILETVKGSVCRNEQGETNRSKLDLSHHTSEPQSKPRMCCRPYRCSGCKTAFTQQGELQGHSCKVKVRGILDYPLISSVMKGCIKLSVLENEQN